MRPRIVEYLDGRFQTRAFEWFVPVPAFMYALAMLVVLVVFVRRSAMAGLSRHHAAGSAAWAMLGGMLGSRLFFLLQHIESTMADPGTIFQLGGVASWGAFLGGFAGFVLYCRIYRLPILPLADALISCLGLGIALGRWSCFLNGDDFGTLSNLPWSVRFPHASFPFVSQVRAGLIDPLADLSLPVHPVQLYLALNGLLLFVVITLAWRKYRHRPGLTFSLYWLCYSATRFMLEFLRGDQIDRIATLTVPQVVGIVVFLVSASGLWQGVRPPKLSTSPDSDDRLSDEPWENVQGEIPKIHHERAPT